MSGERVDPDRADLGDGDAPTDDPDEGPDSDAPSLRALAAPFLFPVVLTGLVYLGLWGGSLPPAPGPGELALAVSAGAALGTLSVALETREGSSLIDSDAVVLALLVAVLAAAYLLFQDGVPVAVGVGLIVAGWTDFFARVAHEFGVVRAP